MTNHERAETHSPAARSWCTHAGRRHRDRVVGQATGILTVHHQCSADDALRWLMATARSSGQKAHLIAQEIVDAQNEAALRNRSVHPGAPEVLPQSFEETWRGRAHCLDPAFGEQLRAPRPPGLDLNTTGHVNQPHADDRGTRDQTGDGGGAHRRSCS